MRVQVDTYNVYQFSELSEQAKEGARQWYREGALDHDWWDHVYEDAKDIGLTITEFDEHWAKGKLHLSIADSVQAILKNHGTTCATYQVARRYVGKLAVYQDIQLEKVHQAERAGDQDLAAELADDDIEVDLVDEYLYDLCRCYAKMLQEDRAYLMSDESVDESITSNEYEFLESGKRARTSP